MILAARLPSKPPVKTSLCMQALAQGKSLGMDETFYLFRRDSAPNNPLFREIAQIVFQRVGFCSLAADSGIERLARNKIANHVEVVQAAAKKRDALTDNFRIVLGEFHGTIQNLVGL